MVPPSPTLGQVRYQTARRPPSSAYQDCEHQINRVGPKKMTQAVADLFYGLLPTYPREGTQTLTGEPSTFLDSVPGVGQITRFQVNLIFEEAKSLKNKL